LICATPIRTIDGSKLPQLPAGCFNTSEHNLSLYLSSEHNRPPFICYHDTLLDEEIRQLDGQTSISDLPALLDSNGDSRFFPFHFFSM
jgi:hypothetical protein